MSDEQSSPADVTAEVSHSEVDHFFEVASKNKGKEREEDISESEPEQETQEAPAKEVDEKEPEQPEKQFEGNYKAAMQEERERRKEMQRELQEQQSKTQRLEQTFQRMIDQAQYQQMQQQQAREPSFDEDPLGALHSRQSKIEQALQQQHMVEAQRNQEYQVQQQQNNFISQYQEKAFQYLQTNPEFKEAYKFLDDNRLQEHIEAGFPPQVARQLLVEDEMAIVARAFQDGVNPAERLYKMAKLRGFQSKGTQSNSTQAQKLDQLEKGLNASKSLSNAGGKSPQGLTLEAAASMDDDEFAKVDWSKLMKLG